MMVSTVGIIGIAAFAGPSRTAIGWKHGLDEPNAVAVYGSLLYIADSGFWPNPDWPHHVRAFEVAHGNLRNSRVVADVSPGIPDGFRVDVNGNIWTSAGDGIHCITPGGDLIGKIFVPEKVANGCFGGPARDRLYICGHTSLYEIHVNTRGSQAP